LLACAAGLAQKKAPCPTAGTDNPWLGMQTVRLWPGDAPQAKGNACEDTPTLTLFSPHWGDGNGSAVIVMPGGGYSGLAAVHEGREFADWFTERGFHAFILSYRLASSGYLLPVPLIDARRAIQTVRARAADYHIDPHRIVIIGFSAGGHLAALAATEPVPGSPTADDPIERVSSRPDLVVLGYPWIDPFTDFPVGTSYCKTFHAMDRCEELRKAYSPDLFVSKDTPPVFIFHTFNDQRVPVEQSLKFFDALVKAGDQSEMHIFSNGHHGAGLGGVDPALEQWPNLLDAWLRAHGMLGSAGTP
jgi:acetyl esterase/lipase